MTCEMGNEGIYNEIIHFDISDLIIFACLVFLYVSEVTRYLFVVAFVVLSSSHNHPRKLIESVIWETNANII